jgi:hypothetical protein
MTCLVQCHSFGLDHLDQAPSYLSGSRSRLDWVAGKAWLSLGGGESGGMATPWTLIDSPPTFFNSPVSLRPSFLISCEQLDIAFTASYQGNSILIGRGSGELKPIRHHFSLLISPSEALRSQPHHILTWAQSFELQPACDHYRKWLHPSIRPHFVL